MLNALKSIILKDDNKNKTKIMKKLYLSKDKKNFIELQFLNGFITNDILKLYGSEIFDKLENNKDYKFLLIDDKNINIEIILKPHEKIFDKLLNENINIYYLPVKKTLKNEEEEINNLINDEINLKKNFTNNNFFEEENLIFKEKIIKFSRKKRKTIEVKAKLFSNYLQLYDKKKKKTNLIIISNIEKIYENKIIFYKPNKNYIFLEIDLKNENNNNNKKKSFFLLFDDRKDYIKWFNLISTQYNCFLDNINTNNNIKNINNLNHEKSLLLKKLIDFIENKKDLKDLIENKFIRNFILNNIIQKNLSVIFNDIFFYKNNLKLLKFNDAWLNLIELIEYFTQKKEFINFDEDFLNKLNQIKNDCKEIMFKNEKNNNNDLINEKLNQLLNFNLFDHVLDNLINNYLKDELNYNEKIKNINNSIVDLYPCEKNFYVDINKNLNNYLIPE